MTIQLTLIIWSTGLVFGGALGVSAVKFPTLAYLSRVTAFFFGSIPVVVTLVWFYYPAQTLLRVNISSFWTAAWALSIVNIFVVSETVRPALVRFPREFAMAALVYGMSPGQALRYITLPLLMRQLLPALLFSQVTMLQATLFASLISVREIFKVTQEINATELQPVELFTALAVLFLLVCAPLNGLALYLQRRYGRDLSEA